MNLLKQNSTTLDITDLKILDWLQKDASLSNQELAEKVFVSPPTCLRRVKRLKDLGFIQSIVALLNEPLLAQELGHGLSAVIEITLDKQGTEHKQAFAEKMKQASCISMCMRVSTGPDFVLIMHASDMPHFLALSQNLFTQDANVRNVKSYFCIEQIKFSPRVGQSLV